MAIDLHDFIHDEDAANVEKLRYYMENRKLDCKVILEGSEYWSIPTAELLKHIYAESVDLMKYAVMLLFRNGFIDPDPDPLTRQSTCIMTDEIRNATSNLWHALYGLCCSALPISAQIDDAHREAILEACLDGWKDRERTSEAEAVDVISPELKPSVSNHIPNDSKSMGDDKFPKEFYTYILGELWETIIEVGSEEVKREIEAQERMFHRFRR